MGEILPNGKIQGYQGYCNKCGKVIDTNTQGNEMRTHKCIAPSEQLSTKVVPLKSFLGKPLKIKTGEYYSVKEVFEAADKFKKQFQSQPQVSTVTDEGIVERIINNIDGKLKMFETFNPADRFNQGAVSHLSSIKQLALSLLQKK